MEPFKTHGAFSWNELMTSDPQAAATFYAALFGWKYDTLESDKGPYRVIKVDNAGVGGIMKVPAEAGPMPPAWFGYVTVTDIDATARRCTELGGKVLMPPTDIPNVGRFAVLQDPQGAVLNAITYRPM
jgi:predicted enzyme related to lactoylglutathione lyase